MVKRLLLFALAAVAACSNGTAPGTSGIPTITMPPAMGVGAIGTIQGTDAAGFVQTVIGTSPHETGDIAQIQFGNQYARAPFVIVTGGSTAGLEVRAYASKVTRDGFTITTSTRFDNRGPARLDYYFQVITQ